ncbi:MAG: DNA polymerase III subunit alpha [Pseudomonadota bacterium]|nr:DNA polymerase III subunit alpha [Pseudomonadota bacterium]
MSDFVHLRLHTEYSLVDSVVRIPRLIEQVQKLQMSAVALTDQSNVSAMVKFYSAAMNQGVKPIIGADVWIAEDERDSSPSRATFLCTELGGFRYLSQLLTRSYTEGQAHGCPVILRDWLKPELLCGLIALSGGREGNLGQILLSSKPARARDQVRFWKALFPERFYIELQRLGGSQEGTYLERAVNLAAEYDIPVVATNDVRFLDPEEFEVHEARVCIQRGQILGETGRLRDYSEHQYLKSAEEMSTLFGDLPEAIANTVQIAERCSLGLELNNVFLPKFEISSNTEPGDYLRKQATEGLRGRFSFKALRKGEQGKDFDRLEMELNVICQMGYEGYFLIVADFIRWARDNGIPVGPGRGSGAGSLAAFGLGITDLDPIAHDLLFERFLNPERVSMPDFDVDFCIEGRDRVIDYVTTRYGQERVSQIITHGSMAARAVVRDVGRVLGMSYGYVDRIAKLIPFEIGITLKKALKDNDELQQLYNEEGEIRELIDLARSLEGLARNAGTHAGGVVIAPEPLTNFMPLYCEPDGISLTQLDKDDVETLGLVKFDFLGLKTLTVIDKATDAINKQRTLDNENPINITDLSFDDQRTFKLLRACQTTGVFQLESRGMRDLSKRLQPDKFDDLVAIVALFRPGPMHMADQFINRKQGQEAIDYLHPSLEAILRPTYGVILYQEQVMQIAQILADYSLGSADLLRRAMGKKKPEEMASQRSVFVAGAAKKGITEDRANFIFSQMEQFAGYGFNKSHSVAYAVLAYQTAWLKAHYPEAFMAAVMTADLGDTDRLLVLRDDCSDLGITITPPDINLSRFEFTVGGKRQINYGLGAIKGVGRGVAEAIVEERDKSGDFNDLLDLCHRISQQKLSRRTLEALVRAGALDSLDPNRAASMAVIPKALGLAGQVAHASAAGQATLFGEQEGGLAMESILTTVAEWTDQERLAAERESLGLYLTGHPFDEYRKHCECFTSGSIGKILGSLANNRSSRGRQRATFAGLVMDLRRRGNRVILLLDDDTGRIEVTLFEEILKQCKHLVAKDAVLVIAGTLRFDKFLDGWQLTAQSLNLADEAIEEYAQRLTIFWDNSGGSNRDFVVDLRQILGPFAKGSCQVCIEYAGPEASGLMTLGEDWRVKPTRELRQSLSEFLGSEDRYAIHYPKFLI